MPRCDVTLYENKPCRCKSSLKQQEVYEHSIFLERFNVHVYACILCNVGTYFMFCYSQVETNSIE